MVTMRDIALLAGVSQQAVSAALNGNGHSRVSEKTREKVLKIARELHYIPNAAARTLTGVESHAVGILGTPAGGLQGELLREIFAILESRGYKVLLTSYGWPEFSAAAALGELVSRGVDGVLVLGWDDRDDSGVLPEVPLVRLGGAPERADVFVDKELTGYLPTAHLLGHGHRRVHLLRVNDNGASERMDGWRRAHAERGIVTDESMVFDLRELTGSADRLAGALRERGVTALFCHNDYLALKTLRVLGERKIRVPEEIALAGCDGRSFTESGPVGIATVMQPVLKPAEAAVDLLLNRIAAKEVHAAPAGLRIAPVFRPSGSCGCPDFRLECLYRLNTAEFLETDYRLNFNCDILKGE